MRFLVTNLDPLQFLRRAKGLCVKDEPSLSGVHLLIELRVIKHDDSLLPLDDTEHKGHEMHVVTTQPVLSGYPKLVPLGEPFRRQPLSQLRTVEHVHAAGYGQINCRADDGHVPLCHGPRVQLHVLSLYRLGPLSLVV